MPDTAEMQAKFWKALKSDRTLMLGLAADEGHAQPMTAQLDGDGDHGPIYVFTSKETDLVKALGGGARAVGLFASKGHDLFAALDGQLSPHNDRATIERLWNPFVAA